tara:strand:+ start:69 stop:332 length:264 start_codon:yes stop_codon:yes gene_type:complete
MKYILILTFLTIYVYGEGVSMRENKTSREYEICIPTHTIVKYQVRDNRDNMYYGITNYDIDSWTEEEYQWFKTNYTITGLLLDGHVE